MTKPSNRIGLFLAVSCVLSLGLVLGVEGTDAGAQQQVEMRVATVAPEGTPWEQQLRRFKSNIEQASGGRIRVKMFMGGSLGGEKALVRRTAQNSIQGFGGSTAALGTMVPQLNVIEAPFLFSNSRQADRALDGPAKGIVQSLVEGQGFKFGFWAENGFRSWFTRERPIRTPADLNGLRMRSQEALVHLETYRALGATPVPIDVTNVLTSLQTGAVDGFDNTPLYAFATSWYQAAGHLFLSRHAYQPGIIVFSKAWYDGLSGDLQSALTSIEQSEVQEGRQAVRQMDPVLVRNLGRQRVEVHTPSDEELAPFREATSGVADAVARRAGSRAAELLRALRR